MQKILVPVRGDGKGDNVFAHVVALARPFNAHIVVAHCRTRPQDMIPFGVAVPAGLRDQIIAQSTEIYNQVEAGIRGEIEALCEQHGAQLSDVPLSRRCFGAFYRRRRPPDRCDPASRAGF